MGVWDWMTKPLGGGTTTPFEMFMPVAIEVAGGLLKPDPQENYMQTQSYAEFNAQQQAIRDQAQQAASMAELQATLAANKEAAAIQAEAMLKAAKIQAKTNVYSTQARVSADILAERLKAKRGIPEVIQRAGENVTSALVNRGQLGQKGFSDAAQVLASFKR